MEAATCLADEMSFSSLAWPCTAALAASQRLLVAAATIRACGERGSQGVCRSLPAGGCALTVPKTVVGHGMVITSFCTMFQMVGKGGRSVAAFSPKEKHMGRESPKGGFPPSPEHDLHTHG